MLRGRRPLADRRGVGVAEYALLLFIIIAGVAIAYRFIGKSVKHAGNKTEEQFQAGGNKTAANANSAGGSGTATAGGTAAAADTAGGGAGGSGGAGGAGGAGGGAGGGKAASGDQTTASAGGDEAEEERGTPLWKIIGGVFVLLFAVGGYFAFRKQSKGG